MTRWQPRQQPVVLIVYMVGLYMTVVDNTILFTALPSVARDFHSSLADAQWVTIGYLLSLAVMVPSSGWIGDRFGTRRTYLIALTLFTAASVACGLAQSLPELIIFRIVQGLGGGLIVPVGQSILFRTYPPEQRARATGIASLGISLGPATGPVLGGILVTELSWRWCFFVNVPFGLTALAIAVPFLLEHREPASGRFDAPGFFLGGAGLALFLYAISVSPMRGWGSPVVLGTLAAGLVALAAFVVVELRRPDPMLNLRLLANRIFRTTSLVFVLSQCAYLGYLFIMPEFLQQARGDNALQSGLTTLPGAVGLWLNSQLAARFYPRVGPRRMAVGAMAGVACIFCLFVVVLEADTNVWLIRLLVFCSGSCIGWLGLAVQAAAFSTISSADTGRAAALFQTQTQAAGGIGVAVLVTVVSLAPAGTAGAALVPDFHHAFLTAMGFIVAAGLVALTIRDSDAANSMRARARGARVTEEAAADSVAAEGAAGPAGPELADREAPFADSTGLPESTALPGNTAPGACGPAEPGPGESAGPAPAPG